MSEEKSSSNDRNTGSGVVEHAKQAATEVVEQVHEKAEELKQNAKSAAQHAAHNVRRVADQALGAAGVAAHSAVDATEQVAENTLYKADEVIQNTTERISEATRPAVEAIGDFAQRTEQSAQRARSEVRNRTTTWLDIVKSRPVVTLAAIALGWLALRAARSRTEHEVFEVWEDEGDGASDGDDTDVRR